MSTKRTYGQAFTTIVPKKPFRPFPQNTTPPMVLYRKPYQFSLSNPPFKKTPVEKKNVDFPGSIGNQGSSVWSELDCINSLPQGTSGGERIGRKIQLRSMLIRWNASTSATNASIRILIVYDKQGEGLTAPPITSVLATNNFNSPMAMGTSDRFVVLADQISNAPGQNVLRADSFYRKINLPMQFLNAGGAIADISSGAIYIMSCVLNGPTGAGIGYYSRIRYTDV